MPNGEHADTPSGAWTFARVSTVDFPSAAVTPICGPWYVHLSAGGGEVIAGEPPEEPDA